MAKRMHLEDVKTICNHCGKEFEQEYICFYLCKDCAKKEFYTIEYFHVYFDTFALWTVYHEEFGDDIYNIENLTEFVNEDVDHFLEFCIDCYNS